MSKLHLKDDHKFVKVCYWDGDLSRNIYAIRDGAHVIAEFHDISVWDGYSAEDEADEFMKCVEINAAL